MAKEKRRGMEIKGVSEHHKRKSKKGKGKGKGKKSAKKK